MSDRQGARPQEGTATFSPSAVLTGTGDQVIADQDPVVVSFGSDGVPVVSLLATDNPQVAPAGWTWSVRFAGTTLRPASFSFALPHSAGTSRRLSDLVPAPSAGRKRNRRAVLAATAVGIGGIAASAALQSSAGRGAAGSQTAGGGPGGSASRTDCLSPDPLPVPRTIITQFQPGSGFVLTGAATSSAVNDARPRSFICGTQAATVVTMGDGITFANLTSRALRFDTAGKYLAVRYRLSSVTATRTLELEVSNDPWFANCYSWQFADRTETLGSGYSYDHEWEQIFLSFADASVTGRPSRQGVTAARLRVQDSGKPVTVQWQEISLIDDPGRQYPKGVATICFDDTYETQYTGAMPVLKAAGFPATIAAIREVIGLDHSMTLRQLRELQDELGWEIGCHSDSIAVHRATDIGVSLSVMKSDLRRELAYLRRTGFHGDKVLAYPSGLWNPAVLGVARNHCGAARLDAFRTQETFPPANPYKLRACGSISSVAGAHTAADVRGYIDAAAANRSWLILVFHKIISGVPAQRTECRLSDFKEIIAHLAASDMAVRTIADVMQRARRQPA